MHHGDLSQFFLLSGAFSAASPFSLPWQPTSTGLREKLLEIRGAGQPVGHVTKHRHVRTLLLGVNRDEVLGTRNRERGHEWGTEEQMTKG